MASPVPSTRRARSGLAQAFEGLMEMLIKLTGWSTILIVVAILVFMVHGACPLLYKNDWFASLTSTDWHAKTDDGMPQRLGLLAMLVGNFLVALLAMLIAIPMGLAAAVYISEFSTGRTKEWLKIAIEGLAAVPSIVWGFIGISILSPFMIDHMGATFGANLLNGGIILGLMSVPLIVSLAEDALRAVPDQYREAALALGANKWEIVYKVLFPAGKTGLMAACMLGVGRAVGETMAVLMATGNRNIMPHSLLDPITTLTAIIASEMGEVRYASPHYQALFMLGVVLLLFTGAVNLTAQIFIRRNR